MTRIFATFMSFLPAIVSADEFAALSDNSPAAKITAHPQTRLVATGPNFVVRSHPGGPSASETLEECEQWHKKLCQTWLGQSLVNVWNPRCEVILHGNRESYRAAVGAGQTSGSSFIKFNGENLIARRIDLLADANGRTAALPHELAHVVLADCFGKRPLPLWIDEGVATMADSLPKRNLHYRDCQNAFQTGSALRMFDIMRLERLSSYGQAAAFYGQSLMLVEFLVQQQSPAQLIAFAELAMHKGYDEALRRIYAIDGVPQLERKWRTFVFSKFEQPQRAGDL